MRNNSSISLNLSSVELLPTAQGAALFSVDSSKVFKEDTEITPVTLSNKTQYMPWGLDDQIPYQILELIERDETLSTCQIFNAEICYGNGLQYNTEACNKDIKSQIEDFFLTNYMPGYFLGVSQDFKYFGWCVSVIILDNEGKHIVGLQRKEVIYCRFSVADNQGISKYILYANWKKAGINADEIEFIPLLNPYSPWLDLQSRMAGGKCRDRKFAVVARIPTPDSTYYPIPYYASLFKGKWYNIKQLIGTAKEAKLRNSAPIKYHIEIAQKYWDGIFKRERITDHKAMQDRVVEEKRKIIDFLTGAENSGKALFSTFYVSPTGEEQHDVVINKIDTDKEGGDWESDIQEAINMFCFTMRVHSNLVGSVPGKSQTNNSGSDKRELYTIAQALQKPYHDLLFTVHSIIIKFNQWTGAFPECPFIQLTTLDENKDAKLVKTENKNAKADLTKED